MVYLPNDNFMNNELSAEEKQAVAIANDEPVVNYKPNEEPQKKTAGERKVADMRKQLSDNIEAVTVKRTYIHNGRFAPLGHAWFLVQQIIKRGAKRVGRYEIGVPVELAYIAEHGEEQVIEELKQLYKESFEKPIK